MHQGIDQRSALLLDSERDGLAGEALPQLVNPTLQGLWCLIQTEALPLATVGFLQRHHMLLIRPIQSDKCSNLDLQFRHLQPSPWLPSFKTIPAGSAHNPYSGVLEGQHLSIRSTPRPDRARKSPSTVDAVGWLIRNATQPVFHEGNSLQKEKRTKKEKENGLWKMPQLWKSAKPSVAYGTFLSMRISTAAWKSLEKARGFPTFTTGPITIINMEETFILKTIRGGCAIKKIAAPPPLKAQTGWSLTSRSAELTTPALSRHPSCPRRGVASP
jgi:hypothetical protein